MVKIDLKLSENRFYLINEVNTVINKKDIVVRWELMVDFSLMDDWKKMKACLGL